MEDCLLCIRGSVDEEAPVFKYTSVIVDGDVESGSRRHIKSR